MFMWCDVYIKSMVQQGKVLCSAVDLIWNMDATFYVKEILEKTLLPFIESRFPNGHRFQQDNDPKQRSRLTQAFNRLEWNQLVEDTTESPDLNPIELIWHELKHFLCTHVKPTTKDGLLGGMTQFWKERMTPEKCMTYVNHLQKVVPLVVQRQGRASGH